MLRPNGVLGTLPAPEPSKGWGWGLSVWETEHTTEEAPLGRGGVWVALPLRMAGLGGCIVQMRKPRLREMQGLIQECTAPTLQGPDKGPQRSQQGSEPRIGCRCQSDIAEVEGVSRNGTEGHRGYRGPPLSCSLDAPFQSH